MDVVNEHDFEVLKHTTEEFRSLIGSEVPLELDYMVRLVETSESAEELNRKIELLALVSSVDPSMTPVQELARVGAEYMSAFFGDVLKDLEKS